MLHVDTHSQYVVPQHLPLSGAAVSHCPSPHTVRFLRSSPLLYYRLYNTTAPNLKDFSKMEWPLSVLNYISPVTITISET